jgi:uncharacterized protein YjbI with pentapeptide repeats
MTPDKMTLPITPHDFWLGIGLIAFVMLSVLIFWVLNQMDKTDQPQLWDDLPAKWRWPVVLMGLVWLGLFGLTVWAAFAGVWQTINPKGSSSQPSLGFGTLLVALLGAPFLIWTTVLKHQTVRYQKEGHMTDRINKAVEQLGAEKTVKVPGKDAEGKDITVERTDPNIEVRIGAILSLERIAQDSTTHDKGRDHVRVMEILCAYVRENAPASSAKDSLRQIWERESQDHEHGPGQTEEQFMARHRVHPDLFDHLVSIDGMKEWAHALPQPRIDIMQALHVIGRRTEQQRLVEATWPVPPIEKDVCPFEKQCPTLPSKPSHEALSKDAMETFLAHLDHWKAKAEAYPGYRLDLANTNLQGADLSSDRPDGSDAVFSGAIFTGARMEGARLWKARLDGAKLAEANLQGANLWLVRLGGANLCRAQLQGANLSQVQMQGTILQSAHLEGADLIQPRLEGAELSKAYMEGVFVESARLEGANLSFARMAGSTIKIAQMEWANLESTRMNDATLAYVRLDGASFREAQLEGAALECAQAKGTTFYRSKIAMAYVKGCDLTLARMSQAQVDSIFGDASVILSANLIRPTHWPTWSLEEEGVDYFEEQLAEWRANPDNYTPPPPP